MRGLNTPQNHHKRRRKMFYGLNTIGVITMVFGYLLLAILSVATAAIIVYACARVYQCAARRAPDHTKPFGVAVTMVFAYASSNCVAFGMGVTAAVALVSLLTALECSDDCIPYIFAAFAVPFFAGNLTAAAVTVRRADELVSEE